MSIWDDDKFQQTYVSHDSDVQQANYKLDIAEVVGNEHTLNLGGNVSTVRKFLIRQVPAAGQDDFLPIPFSFAKQIFVQHIKNNANTYDGLPYREIRFFEEKDKIGELFDAEVTYSWDYRKAIEDMNDLPLPTFSMTGGKRKQVWRKLEWRKSSHARPGKQAVEYYSIGWDGKKFNGVEVASPILKFTLPGWYPESLFKQSHNASEETGSWFMTTLSDYVGRINSEPFYGFSPGEVLYLGPEQSWVTRIVETGELEKPIKIERYIELQHQFHVQKTLRNVYIGNDITIPIVRGWDHVDVHYEHKIIVFSDGHRYWTAVPMQADVLQVNDEANFYGLWGRE